MDKELLRIVIIATGFLVIIGMILWSFIKNRRALADQDIFGSEQVIGSSDSIDDSLKLHHERDEFDIVPIGSAKHNLNNDDSSDWDTEFNDNFDDELQPIGRQTIPEIIQFAIVAQNDDGFTGVELAMAFGNADLEYGDLKVYEKINKNGGVDYGVACIVEPGTFPYGEEMASFNCPGIVFFLQHQELEDAQIVFDDFVDTVKAVAKELDGEIWDHQRQPLTEETIQAIRRSL